jgi:hypothetical protein
MGLRLAICRTGWLLWPVALSNKERDMRRSETTALVLVCLLGWACGDRHHGDHSQPHGESAHDSGEGAQGLQLNDGKKWVMDDHTRSMFATMVGRVEGWDAGGEAAEELGGALENDLDALIQGCTMTGEAHTQLHRFLMDLIPAIEKLVAREGDQEVRRVKELLAVYPRYFA